MDPFVTLGIQPTFAVDLAALERTHRDLSRALHPDRYVDASATERRAALTMAVEVNEAWRIVRDPIRRADALLALGGVVVSEASRPKADPEFLMEMLEQREALSDAKQARDLAAVRKMAAVVEARAAAAEAELGAGFERARGVRGSPAEVAAAFASLVAKVGELRFYRRFLDEVSAIEDELAA